MTTITQATSGQKKQNSRFLEDAFQALKTELETMFGELDTENAQRFLGNGDEFKADVQKAALDSFGRLSISNQFANEEVESTYGYLSGYQKPKGLTEQANRLRELFSGAGFVNLDLQGRIEKGEIALPAYAEGWSVIPNWMKNPEAWGTYNEALQKVLDAIKKTRNGAFYNYREGQIGPERLRQTKRAEKFFRELSEAQGNPDLLIVPTQFGIRHRGRSVRRSREVMLDNGNEFGLGAFAIGIMILAHPERLKNVDDLWIDCAGDEYAPGAGVRFDRAPYFNFNDGGVGFDAGWTGSASGRYGSSSAFLPQQ